MAFLDKFHRLIARKLTIKGSEPTPLDIQNRTADSKFSVDSSGNVIAAGTLAVTGAQTFTGATTVSGTLGVTGAATLSSTLDVTGAATVGSTLAVTGAVNYKRQVTDTGGAFATPIVLTTAQSGRLILVDDAAGLDFTLPAIAAADIGTFFDFCVTVTVSSNSFRVTAATGDLLFGALWVTDFDTANTGAYFAADGTDDLVMTMNGSTQGGKVGTKVRFTATSATQWFVEGVAHGDGALATPFS